MFLALLTAKRITPGEKCFVRGVRCGAHFRRPRDCRPIQGNSRLRFQPYPRQIRAPVILKYLRSPWRCFPGCFV
jgi:hypothetical protein